MDLKIKHAILASLVADTYALGGHWIYDEKQLQDLPIDWDTLNAPQAMWHKGKEKGDFTHYGDQTFFLLEYMVENNNTFNKEDFYSFWSEKMSHYEGYIDGATRAALGHMGSASNDLSICGRIAPLLLGAQTKEIFLIRVQELVSITHNSPLTHTASQFFAELLWDNLETRGIVKNIEKLKIKYPTLLSWINQGLASQDKDTFTSIRDFGPACGIDGGFSGVIHLLCLQNEFKTTMQKNAKAGGDSSARGMVVAMILATQDDCALPQEWVNAINKIEEIKKFLEEKR
jgi:ADP-ribosylglycohydrolase